MSEQDRTERIGEKLRKLADILDNNPALEQFPALFGYSIRTSNFAYHRVGDEAAELDQFAAAFGVEVTHRVHSETAEEPGARYSGVEASVDGVLFSLQCRTEDYEKATGKTVDNGGAE
jgi:hypothetical protein